MDVRWTELPSGLFGARTLLSPPIFPAYPNMRPFANCLFPLVKLAQHVYGRRRYVHLLQLQLGIS